MKHYKFIDNKTKETLYLISFVDDDESYVEEKLESRRKEISYRKNINYEDIIVLEKISL